MMRQYREIKAQYPGAILFFRLGDFYEMFEEDALEVSKLLGLTLTQRGGVPMCGVPHHSSENYLKNLLQHGRKVAICEQVSNNSLANKGLFERKITEVLTPGTLVDDAFLEPRTPSYIVCLYPEDQDWRVVFWGVSTGELWTGSVRDSGDYPGLQQLFERFQPREILIPEGTLDSYGDLQPLLGSAVVEELPRSWYLRELDRDENNLENLLIDFQDDEFLFPALRCLGRYWTKMLGHPMLPFWKSHRLKESDRLFIDSSSLRNLELVTSAYGDSSMTFYSVIDETLTPGGARLLRQEIQAPPANPEQVKASLDKTSWFYHHPLEHKAAREHLRGIGDLERVLTRLSLDRASPYDVLNLGSILEKTLQCHEEVRASLALDADLHTLSELLQLIKKAIHPDAPRIIDEGPRIRDGYNSELDHWRQVSKNGEKVLEDLRDRDSTSTGLPLKLKYNRVLGYFYELTRVQAANIPANFIRRQSLSNAERFTTESLLEAEMQLAQSRDKAEELDRLLFIELRSHVAQHLAELRTVADWLKTIDYHQALAEVARRNRWTCPVIETNPVLEIVNGRHPVVERFNPPGSFVPNDLSISKTQFFHLVTGPNMAGKSTYLRQNALIVLLAHMGSFVPADHAVIGLADKIFCRVGAYDRLAKGDSTFMVEMKETAFILRNATSKSLVIMDEVGRGTSTQDGLALARAISEYLLDVVRARTLFSTHYHELTELNHPAFQNVHMEVMEQGDEVVFLRRAKQGAAGSSYGIYAAKLAGIPEVVLRRAEHLLRQDSRQQHVSTTRDYYVAELFSPLELIGSEVVSLNLDKLSPRQALDYLYRLQDRYRGTKAP